MRLLLEEERLFQQRPRLGRSAAVPAHPGQGLEGQRLGGGVRPGLEDVQRAGQPLLGRGVAPALAVDLGPGDEEVGDQRVVGADPGLGDGRGAIQQPLGLVEVRAPGADVGQGAQGGGDQGVVGARTFSRSASSWRR